jgi:hypothetical protein
MATIPSRKATFTEEEKRKLVEGTDAQGKPLSESEKMKLSKMHTARTLGADWRERAAERSKAEEPARAQQALAERAAANRKTQYESPLQETVTKTQINLPGGGKVKYGIDTLASMRDFETKQAEEKAALQAKREGALSAMRQKAGTALRQRYEDELASRGFAPPKTRQDQEAIDRARREEFDTITAARNAARMKEKQAVDESRAYKQLARMARKSGDFVGAAAYNQEVIKREADAGGDIRNATARRSVFEDREMQAARERINQARSARRESMKVQNTSNPEASSFTQTSSAAPMNVGGSLSYNLPYENVKGPTEQPFGLRTPSRAQDYLPSYLESPTGTTAQSTIEDGVDFSSISPYNTAGTRTAGTTAPASQPATPKSTAAFPTSTQQTIEDVLPGASNMPVVQRNSNETPAQHNERVLQEYTNNVIIPSFDKQTQDAVRSAIELNKQKSDLSGQRYVTGGIEKYGKVSESLKKDQQVIIKSMKELKSKLRDFKKYPMDSKERTFLLNQIGTLNNQLGFFDKLLN